MLFDGPSRLILLEEASVSADQIWTSYINWVAVEANTKWPSAITQIGGDSLGGGLYIPLYFFLTNGWRVRPMESSHQLMITGNLFVAEGGSPLVNTLGNYNVIAQYTVPVQAQAMATSGGTGGLTSEQATQLMKTATKADVVNAAMM